MKALIHHDYFEEFVSMFEMNADVSDETILALMAERESQAEASAGPDLEVRGGVARIAVRGPLLNGPSFWLDFFGVEYSDYQTIRSLVSQAEVSDKVDSILLDVNSPGGLFDGLVETGDAIFSAKKPVEARISGMAASAGYWLASQADSVVATSRADRVGSIGVAVDVVTSPRLISIASSNAPKKRPNMATPQGQAIVQAELDDLEGLFYEAIERGRGVTADTIRQDFGQGGVVLAPEAARVGMIDSVEDAMLAATDAAPRQRAESGASVGPMNEETLQREHPELYARLVASAEERGVEKERARVAGHLQLAEAAGGATDVALGFIESGEDLNTTKSALAYQTAQLNINRIKLRQEDSPDPIGAGAADAPAADGALSEWAEASGNLLN